MTRRQWTGLAFLMVGSVGCFGDPPAIGPGDVVTVRVFSSDSVLALGDTVSFSAQGLDLTGAFVVGRPATWESDAPNVATVDDNGSVVGAGVGSATITATIDGVVGQATATVSLPQIAVGDSSLVFAAIFGDTDPDSQDVAVANRGPGSLTGLTIGTIQYGSGGSGWITTTFDATTAPTVVTVRASLGALLPGTYTAIVPVQAAGAGNSPVNVDVTFTIVAPPSGAPGMLAVIAEPGGATANSVFTTQPVVEVRDSAGVRVFGATVPITASITSGDGTLIGTTTVIPVNGQATFTDLQIRGVQAVGDTVGFGGHRLEFTAPATMPDTSVSFNVAVSFSYNVEYMFGLTSTSCLACHSTFSDPAVLVNQPPALNVTGCGTLVVPSNSTSSFLMQKLDNTHSGGCGSVMPPAGVLSTRLRNMVRSWIDEGAVEN